MIAGRERRTMISFGLDEKWIWSGQGMGRGEGWFLVMAICVIEDY